MNVNSNLKCELKVHFVIGLYCFKTLFSKPFLRKAGFEHSKALEKR